MKEKLLEILVDICDDEIVREDSDMDLFEEDILDSLGLVELLLAIEDNFGITISPTEYEKKDLSSVNKILHILKEKGVNE